MNEFEPLLHLAWSIASAVPCGAPADSTSPACAPTKELPPVVSPAVENERERRDIVACLLGPEMPRLSSASGAPEIPLHPALTDTWYFGVGACFMSSNTQAQLNSNVGAGAVIDFEQALGLAENAWAPQGLARWRFSDRWRLELEYFSLNRSNTKTTQNDFTWGDTTIPAGTEVTAKFDVSVLRLSCGYSFFKTQDKELGVALGFHVTSFDASIDTSGGSGDEGKVTAPLPVLSGYGMFALTDEWAVQGRLDVFRLEYDPFYGRILSVGIDALYQPWRHWGFGLGWRTLQVSGGVKAADWNGDLQTDYTGPIAFISTSF